MMYRRYSIFPEFSLSILRTGQIVTWEEIRNAIEALYDDPRRRPWYRTLWDLSAIRTLVLQPQDLHISAQAGHDLARVHSHGEFSVVMSRRPDLDLHALYLLQQMAWFREVEVFSSIDKALLSLGHYGPLVGR